MSYRSLFSFLLGFFFLILPVSAQNAYTQYINQYKQLAIDKMQRHRIPASITLAQGLLESAAGQSRLARLANNHFGIKASSEWTGPVILNDDDAKDEKFRKYNSVEESYEDHSKFLLRPRYSDLFKLDIKDYKGWAHTLKRCGYATNPQYANILISVIERYDLAQYDNYTGSGQAFSRSTTSRKDETEKFKGSKRKRKLNRSERLEMAQEAKDAAIQSFLVAHNVNQVNGIYCITALPGDNLESIAQGTGLSKRKIRKYNDIPRGGNVYPGQTIYLMKKADTNPDMRGVAHIVQGGESVYDISQRYGVNLKSIYLMNGLKDNYQPRVGDRIVLWR